MSKLAVHAAQHTVKHVAIPVVRHTVKHIVVPVAKATIKHVAAPAVRHATRATSHVFNHVFSRKPVDPVLRRNPVTVPIIRQAPPSVLQHNPVAAPAITQAPPSYVWPTSGAGASAVGSEVAVSGADLLGETAKGFVSGFEKGVAKGFGEEAGDTLGEEVGKVAGKEAKHLILGEEEKAVTGTKRW